MPSERKLTKYRRCILNSSICRSFAVWTFSNRESETKPIITCPNFNHSRSSKVALQRHLKCKRSSLLFFRLFSCRFTTHCQLNAKASPVQHRYFRNHHILRLVSKHSKIPPCKKTHLFSWPETRD